jgi:hypothetical protein
MPTNPQNDPVQAAIERATEQAYWDWAAAHPSLAAVIDQLTITQQAASRLRESPEFHRAIASYYNARNELNLVNRLAELAGPIVSSILSF